MDTSNPSTQASTAQAGEPNWNPEVSRHFPIPPSVRDFFRKVHALSPRALDGYAPETFDDIAAYETNEGAIPESTWNELRHEHAELRTDPGDDELTATFYVLFPNSPEARAAAARLEADGPIADDSAPDSRPNPRTLDRLDLQAIMTARGELAELHNADELDVAGILALEKLDEILERNDPRTGTTGPRADGPRCEDTEDQADAAKDAAWDAAKAHYLKAKDAPSLARLMRLETEGWPDGCTRSLAEEAKIIDALTQELGSGVIDQARAAGTLEKAFELFQLDEMEEDFRAFDEAEIRKAARAVDEAAEHLLADLAELKAQLDGKGLLGTHDRSLEPYFHRTTELARAVAGLRCALDDDLTAADMALLKPAPLTKAEEATETDRRR